MHWVMLDNVLLVVISESSGELVEVHDWIAFPDAPQPGEFDRVDDPKFETVAGPGEDGSMFAVSEKLQNELPQLDTVTACKIDYV